MIYNCSKCHFATTDNKKYNIHLLSKKHIKNNQTEQTDTNVNEVRTEPVDIEPREQKPRKEPKPNTAPAPATPIINKSEPKPRKEPKPNTATAPAPATPTIINNTEPKPRKEPKSNTATATPIINNTEPKPHEEKYRTESKSKPKPNTTTINIDSKPPPPVPDKKKQIYTCSYCNYTTTIKGSFMKHEISKKHKELSSKPLENKMVENVAPEEPRLFTSPIRVMHELENGEKIEIFVPPPSMLIDLSFSLNKFALTGQISEPTPPSSDTESIGRRQKKRQKSNKKDKKKMSTEEIDRINKERCHEGAMRLLQELSSGRLSANDIAEYMQKNRPDLIDPLSSDDDDDSDRDSDSDDRSHNSDEYSYAFNEDSYTTPQVRHQPTYHPFPPAFENGKLPEGPTYPMPPFVENRHKPCLNQEEDEKQYNEIRRFIVDFLNGTKNKNCPNIEKLRWQLNEITKLFINNNVRSTQNRPEILGVI